MKPDKIFFNGYILTQDKKQPVATAFAVSKGKIVAVDTSDSLYSFQSEGCEYFDLQQATVIPGFNDAHIHIWKVGNLLTNMLDLRGVRSIDELQQRLSDYAKAHPELEWIQARGFNEVLFPDKKMPDRFDLDAVISDRPVSVIRTCAHQQIINSLALRKSGITNQTVVPSGGEIKLLPDGTPSGHFTETAMGLIAKSIPPYRAEEYRTMILAAQEAFLKVGITSATDPAVMPDLLEVYRSMERSGELKIRINAIPVRVPDGATRALPLPVFTDKEFLKVDTVKFFADGGLSGRTAALKQPYRNSSDHGMLRLTKDFFLPMALEARENNFRIATHAIGDVAIDLVLDVYKSISKSGSHKIHNRIEHLGLPSTENLRLMKSLNVSAVMQPIFIRELGENFQRYLPEEYLERVYPVQSVLQHGINLAFSTDAPVVSDFNPLTGILAAINRLDNHGLPIAPNQRITLQEALEAYTEGSAIANGDEHNRGSITIGKRADFVVMDRNMMQVSADEITDCKVIATYIGSNLQSGKAAVSTQNF